jgi:hypothetical protein
MKFEYNFEEEEIFERWKNTIKQTLQQGKIGLEHIHLLQNPYTLRRHNQHINYQLNPYKKIDPDTLNKINGQMYLNIPNKETFNALPILRIYRFPKAESKDGEAHTLTLLYNKKKGNEKETALAVTSQFCIDVRKLIGRDTVLLEYNPSGSQSKGPCYMDKLTPLGKKGILALHSTQQYNEPSFTENESWGRCIFSHNFKHNFIKVAYTLQKLAKGDPKDVELAEKELIKHFEIGLKSLLQELLTQLENPNCEFYKTWNPTQLSKLEASFNEHKLPLIHSNLGVEIRMLPEITSGFNPHNAALFLYFESKALEKNNEVAQEIWTNITKAKVL